ncbi:MAG: hypothetical protein M3Q79_02835 [bacterium]|nr:hypothetical protein [bacterium]
MIPNFEITHEEYHPLFMLYQLQNKFSLITPVDGVNPVLQSATRFILFPYYGQTEPHYNMYCHNPDILPVKFRGISLNQSVKISPVKTPNSELKLFTEIDVEVIRGILPNVAETEAKLREYQLSKNKGRFINRVFRRSS